MNDYQNTRARLLEFGSYPRLTERVDAEGPCEAASGRWVGWVSYATREKPFASAPCELKEWT